ncbi:MAG: hypothetical protein AAGJ81_08115 [Verrucomicrobiota bacterium]
MRILWGSILLAPEEGEAVRDLSNDIQRVVDVEPQTRADHPSIFPRGNALRDFSFTIEREWPDEGTAQDFILRMDKQFEGTERQTKTLRILTDGDPRLTVYLDTAALQRYQGREEGVSTIQSFRFIVASAGRAAIQT